MKRTFASKAFWVAVIFAVTFFGLLSLPKATQGDLWALFGTGTYRNTAMLRIPVAGTSLLPGTNDYFTLGSSSYRFANIYTTLLNVSGATTSAGDMTITGTTPSLTVGDGGEEDTQVNFDGAALDFAIGLDDSADSVVIGTGTTLGSGNSGAISINSSAQVTIPNATTLGTVGLTRVGTGSTFTKADGADDLGIEADLEVDDELQVDGNTVLGNAATDTITLTGITLLQSNAAPRANVTPTRAGALIWNSADAQLCVSTGTTATTWVQVADGSTACSH